MISRRVAGLCTLGFFLILLGTYHPAVRVHLPSLSESLAQDDRDATLGVFSDIYVVSLPTRTDRRASMEQIRQTLGLRWTYLDALPSQDPLVDHIGTCVRSLRDQTAPGTIQWPSEGELERLNLDRDFRLRGAASPAAELPLAFCPAHGAPTPSTDPLTCADDDNTHGVEYSELVMDHHLLTPPKFACWYSHLSAILRYVRTGTGPAALILEDDVDMERDIRARLEDLWETLPEDWDIVYLGESFGPLLAPSASTTHPRRYLESLEHSADRVRISSGWPYPGSRSPLTHGASSMTDWLLVPFTV